jgi:hypothetical protein
MISSQEAHKNLEKEIINNVITMLKNRDKPAPISCFYSEFNENYNNDNVYSFNKENDYKIIILKNNKPYKTLYIDIDDNKFSLIANSLNKDSICLIQDSSTIVKKKVKTKYEDILKEIKKRITKTGFKLTFELFEMKDFKNDILLNKYFPIIFKIDISSVNTISEDEIPIIKFSELYLKYYNLKENDIICILNQKEIYNPLIKIIK